MTSTRAGIHQALKFPKPRGALDREWARENGRLFGTADVTNAERALLRHIAENADELPIARGEIYDNPEVVWMIVPMPLYLLAQLHAFEADLEDLSDAEFGTSDEREADDVDAEDCGDIEPNLVGPMGMKAPAVIGGEKLMALAFGSDDFRDAASASRGSA